MGLKEFGSELLDRARDVINDHEQEAVLEERWKGIELTVLAMREAHVDDEKIVFLLQKHWDLRRSECEELLSQ